MTTIITIDDSDSFRETVSEILSEAGFKVLTASNGKEGLEMVYKESPDLILLDCNMPVLDGFGFMKELRKDPVLYNKPVIMLTSRDSEFDEIKGLNVGIDDYITKPVKPSVLVARIEGLLKRKEQSLSVNPLTQLSGNIAIQKETERKIIKKQPFAMMYLDLSNFKSFNDRYGFQRGDEVIKNTAKILIDSVRIFGSENDFIGHIGGDDFIVLTSPGVCVSLAKEIIKTFDASIGRFYDPDDLARGYIISKDRAGNIKKYFFMTIAIAIISTDVTKIEHYGELASLASELKKKAKENSMSSYVLERRSNDAN